MIRYSSDEIKAQTAKLWPPKTEQDKEAIIKLNRPLCRYLAKMIAEKPSDIADYEAEALYFLFGALRVVKPNETHPYNYFFTAISRGLMRYRRNQKKHKSRTIKKKKLRFYSFDYDSILFEWNEALEAAYRTPMHRTVIEMRLEGLNNQQIADTIGYTRERVRQLQKEVGDTVWKLANGQQRSTAIESSRRRPATISEQKTAP